AGSSARPASWRWSWPTARSGPRTPSPSSSRPCPTGRWRRYEGLLSANGPPVGPIHRQGDLPPPVPGVVAVDEGGRPARHPAAEGGDLRVLAQAFDGA